MQHFQSLFRKIVMAEEEENEFGFAVDNRQQFKASQHALESQCEYALHPRFLSPYLDFSSDCIVLGLL